MVGADPAPSERPEARALARELDESHERAMQRAARPCRFRGEMALASRYWVSLTIVLSAVAATALVFGYGLQRTSSPNFRYRHVDLARVHHYSLAAVRRAFAAHDIHLRYAPPMSGVQILRPSASSQLFVAVGARHGTANWEMKPKNIYDDAFGNLDITYLGTNPATLAAIKAAVTDLR